MNEKQKKFVNEYLKDLNATQAAVRAGYSKKTAYSQGQRMLKNDEVKNYIEKRKKDRLKRVEITQDMVLDELALIAFSKATDYAKVVEKDLTVEVDGKMLALIDENGKPMKYRTVEPILTDELTEEQKKALAVVKRGKDGFEIRPYDKVKALELLGKHLGMFKDKVELEGSLESVTIINDIPREKDGS